MVHVTCHSKPFTIPLLGSFDYPDAIMNTCMKEPRPRWVTPIVPIWTRRFRICLFYSELTRGYNELTLSFAWGSLNSGFGNRIPSGMRQSSIFRTVQKDFRCQRAEGRACQALTILRRWDPPLRPTCVPRSELPRMDPRHCPDGFYEIVGGVCKKDGWNIETAMKDRGKIVPSLGGAHRPMGPWSIKHVFGGIWSLIFIVVRNLVRFCGFRVLQVSTLNWS